VVIHENAAGTNIDVTLLENESTQGYNLVLADVRTNADNDDTVSWFLEIGGDEFLLTTSVAPEFTFIPNLLLAQPTAGGTNKIIVKSAAAEELADFTLNLAGIGGDITLESIIILFLHNPLPATHDLDIEKVDSPFGTDVIAGTVGDFTTKVCNLDVTQFNAGSTSVVAIGDILATDIGTETNLGGFGSCQNIDIPITHALLLRSNGPAETLLFGELNDDEALVLLGALGAVETPFLGQFNNFLEGLAEEGKALFILAALSSAEVDAKVKIANQNEIVRTVGPTLSAGDIATEEILVANLNAAATDAEKVRFFVKGTSKLLGESAPLTQVFVAGEVYIFAYIEGPTDAKVFSVAGVGVVTPAVSTDAITIAQANAAPSPTPSPSPGVPSPQPSPPPSPTPSPASHVDSAASSMLSVWVALFAVVVAALFAF
jgi:hypothetical protein